jgi:hypothetical protein
VDVWAVVSLLVQVTDSPAAMLMGFGAYAVAANVDAPRTTETGVPLTVGGGGVTGVGVGADGDEYDDPQAAVNPSSPARIA